MAPNLSTLWPLKAGDVILDLSHPLIHVVNDKYKGIHCDCCLQKTTSLKRCLNCFQMYYCDKECQRNDWKYHKNECKIFKNKNFSVEVTDGSQRLLIRLLNAIKSDETFVTKKYLMIDGSEISLKDIEINFEKLSSDSNVLFFLYLICRDFDEFGLKFDRKELFHWSSVIYYTIGCQPLTYIASSEPFYESSEIGFGFYIELYSLSHSCSPNSAIIPNGLSLQLRAMEPIDVGSDITISYVRLFNGADDPHKQLKDIFHIDCDCQKFKDYKFERLLNKLFELLVKNMDPFGDRAMPDVCPIVDKIFTTGEQFVGYNPDLTLYLVVKTSDFLSIETFNNENRIKAKTEYYERLEKHILITFGADNRIYQIFKSWHL